MIEHPLSLAHGKLIQDYHKFKSSLTYRFDLVSKVKIKNWVNQTKGFLGIVIIYLCNNLIDKGYTLNILKN